VRDQDINKPEQIAPILTDLGLAAGELLAEAQSEPIKTRLRRQTDEARARGIFGAPTFFVGNEMFWGNDRLDDALLFAAEAKQAGAGAGGASAGRSR
jgi:2-hydroxychromene-2-carboxylate isomerase